LFSLINEFRQDPYGTANRYFSQISSEIKIEDCEIYSDKPLFKWSEPLARAARHVINDQGSCDTTGDAYGNSIEEVLKRYYAFNFTKLNIIEIAHHDIALPAHQALEFLVN